MRQYEGFQKVHEDADSAVMRHENGHEIRIAKKALSKKLLKQLSSIPLAKGGEVPGTKEAIDAFRSGFNGQPAPAPKPKPKAYAEGGEAELSLAGSAMKESAGNPEGLPERTPEEKESDSLGAGLSEAASPLNLAAQSMPAPAEAPADEQALKKSADETVAGIQGLAKEQGKLQQDKAKLYQDYQGQQADIAQKEAKQNEDLLSEHAAAVKDILNTKVDPDRYIHDMHWPKKLATGIGLILGGIGGGLTHQENPVLKALNANIDRDIESQTAELGKKKSLLDYNLRRYKDIKDAQLATRLQRQSALGIQLEQAAAKAGTQAEKQRALIASGQVHHQVAKELEELHLRQATMQAKTTPAQQALDRSYAKEYNEWTSTGKATNESNLHELEEAKKNLEENSDLSGGFTGRGPEYLTSNKVLEQRQLVHGAILSSLKQALGAQFTEREGEKVFKTVYNEAADAGTNIKALDNYINKIKAMRESNDEKAAYYEQHGSLAGYKSGSAPHEAAGDTIERVDPKTRRTIIYDAKTKKPLRVKQ